MASATPDDPRPWRAGDISRRLRLDNGWYEVYERGTFRGLFDDLLELEAWVTRRHAASRYQVVYRALYMPDGREGHRAVMIPACRMEVRPRFGDRPDYRRLDCPAPPAIRPRRTDRPGEGAGEAVTP